MGNREQGTGNRRREIRQMWRERKKMLPMRTPLLRCLDCSLPLGHLRFEPVERAFEYVAAVIGVDEMVALIGVDDELCLDAFGA